MACVLAAVVVGPFLENKVVGRGREDLACYILILWLQKVNTVAIISLNHLRYLQLGSLCPISFLLS